jgi:uncharacterized protein YfdQ (DUF2303 family)
MDEDNNIGSAIEAGRQLGQLAGTLKQAKELLHSLPFVILRDAQGAEKIEYVDRQIQNPTFHRGIVKLLDSPSFIEYVNRNKGASCAIYASLEPAKFVAVLDEHPPGQARPASWRDFRAEYAPALSREWTTWAGHNGSQRAFDSTEEFAYFVEDNAPDFIAPVGAEMMELALDFRVKSNATYKAVSRLQDGNVSFQYQNEVEGRVGAGDTRKMPEMFRIKIPVFMGINEAVHEINARFRYRLTGGHLKLWYELERPHKVLEAAFKKLHEEIHAGVNTTPPGVALHLGTTD